MLSAVMGLRPWEEGLAAAGGVGRRSWGLGTPVKGLWDCGLD